MATFIYVISGEHGRQKIGVTDNPRGRLGNLQTGSPYPLSFAFVGATDDDAAGAIEVEAHFMLSAHRASGEWFVVPPDVAITAVMAAAHRLGYRLTPVDPNAAMAPRVSLVRAPLPPWAGWTALALALAVFFAILAGTDHVLTALIGELLSLALILPLMRRVAAFTGDALS
jgi:hypothetical protein